MTIVDWVAPEDLENSTSDFAEPAVRLASRILFSLTGRIYGGEKATVETYVPRGFPCDSLITHTLVHYGIGTPFRVMPYRIGVSDDMRIPLRRRPVRAINEVTVVTSGDVVSPSEYWISDSTYLTTRPTVPITVGLNVDYVYGTNPPEDGVAAARALADELILLLGNDNKCRLKNVTSYSRQGVNFEIEDARTILTDGRTGIPEVDLFVASVNPTRARLRSRVFSPDAYQVH